MPRADQFLSQFHSDDEFLDRKSLVGQVYHMVMQTALEPNKAKRHHITMHIIADVMESLTPACQGCGAPIKDVTCERCRRRKEGILNINF